MRKVILSIILCVTAVIVKADGELPKGATAQTVEVGTECVIKAGGEEIVCSYDPYTQTWTPAGIEKSNPQVANCLDAAAAGIHNSAIIAGEFNTLLKEFNDNKKLTDAEISALKENYAAIMEKLKDLSDVDVNSCDLCDHETKFNSITIDDDKGGYKIDTISSSGCAVTAKKTADSIVTMGQAIAADRARITAAEVRLDNAEVRLDNAEATLEDHGGRISELENANNDYATKESVKDLESKGENEHNNLLRKIGGVRDDLNAHIANCDGDGDGTNIIEIATCDLCSNTNGISMASLDFQPRKEGSLGKPEVPAQIVSEATPVDGCEEAVSQLESNINALISAVEYVLPVPPKLDEHIDWAEEDSAAQWDAINSLGFGEVPYTGSISTLAEALDPNKKGEIGGKIMFQPSASSTNYFTLPVGKLDFPECDGLSSNDVENLVNFLLESFNGGCPCTPDEYIKEETDPIWEEEKAGYVTKDEFENTREALMAAMEQMQKDIESINTELGNLRTEFAHSNVNVNNLLNEVAVLQSANNNINTRIDELSSRIGNLEGGN